MPESFKPDTPQRSKARAMGEIMSMVETVKSDAELARRVREIVARSRKEAAAWKAALNEHGLPSKTL